jgi:hypothetical protein
LGIIAYEIDDGHCLSLGMFSDQRLTNIHSRSPRWILRRC